MDIPDEYSSRSGLRFGIDTNIIIDGFEPAAEAELHELHGSGWINLARTDTLDLEIEGGSDEVERQRHLALSAHFPESLGVARLGHSRWDHAVYATRDDEDRFARVWAILGPGRPATKNVRAQHIRDAMHIDTSIRYGFDGFVTRDRRLLRRATRLRQAFNGFLVLAPEPAVELARRRSRHFEIRTVHWCDPED